MIHPIVLAATLLTAFSASAQIYSWKDKDGRPHYGDTPPPSVEATPIRAPQAPPAPPPPPGAGRSVDGRDPAPPASLAEREQAFRERRAAAAEAEAAADAAAARRQELERFCSAAKNELAALRSGQRMARFNARGEREFLDDDTRAAEIGRLEQQTSERCR